MVYKVDIICKDKIFGCQKHAHFKDIHLSQIYSSLPYNLQKNNEMEIWAVYSLLSFGWPINIVLSFRLALVQIIMEAAAFDLLSISSSAAGK